MRKGVEVPVRCGFRRYAARPALNLLRSRRAGIMYGLLGLERADAVSMQHGILDWPTLLSHAVAPEHSVGAGRIMRQTLLNVPCRHLLI